MAERDLIPANMHWRQRWCDVARVVLSLADPDVGLAIVNARVRSAGIPTWLVSE